MNFFRPYYFMLFFHHNMYQINPIPKIRNGVLWSTVNQLNNCQVVVTKKEEKMIPKWHSSWSPSSL